MIWAACAVLVLLSGAYVLMPLFREPRQGLQVELMAETEFDRLLDRRAVIYGNLSDLEFEYKMGRLSDSDYEQLGARYKNEAAGILQRLDKLSASENLDEATEKEIEAHKARRYASGKKAPQQVPLCPSCGAEVLAGKKYCADCGCRL
jgi:hypothetical protein